MREGRGSEQPDGRLPVVHIGYSRTGSTWLQEVVFPRMRGVKNTWGNAVWRDLTWKLGTADEDRYFEETLRAFVEEFASKFSDAALIYTQNEISGYYLDPVSTMWRSAERVKRLFPEARILAITRRQDQILLALYGLYVRTGGHRPLRDLLEGRPIEGWTWDRSYLEYDRLIERYIELYGSEHVKVIPYELARSDRDRFLTDLCEFCGGSGYDDYDGLARRVNPSFSAPAAFALRTWNGLFVQSRFNSKPRFGARSAGLRAHQILAERVDPLLRRINWRWPSTDDRSRLDDFAAGYAENNARLQQHCGYSLAQFGYPLPNSEHAGPRDERDLDREGVNDADQPSTHTGLRCCAAGQTAATPMTLS